MDDKKHPADAIADRLAACDFSWTEVAEDAEAMLRRLPALEAERDAMRAELAALKAQTQIPSDMAKLLHENLWSLYVTDDAAPQAAQPLTDEQIAYCIFEARMESGVFKRDGTMSFRIARAVERAHGIGKEPKP